MVKIDPVPDQGVVGGIRDPLPPKIDLGPHVMIDLGPLVMKDPGHLAMKDLGPLVKIDPGHHIKIPVVL